MWPGRVVALISGGSRSGRWRGGRIDGWAARRRVTRIAFVALVALSTLGCSEGDPDRIRVVVDVAEGHRLSAEGPAVADGRFCAEGLHQATGHEDLASGEALMPAEVEFRNRRIIAAADPEAVVDYVVIAEWVCSDGSGSLSVRLEPADGGSWEIVGGRGAHAGLVGGGSVAIERPEGRLAWRNPATVTTMELVGVVMAVD